MDRQIFFLSGLPRSGSTLLANILAQNPDVFSTPTSACHDGLLTIRNNWHPQPRDANDPITMKMWRVLGSIMEGWHKWDTLKADEKAIRPHNLGRIIEEMAKVFPEDNYEKVLSAFLYNYHDTDKPIIFDKGRGWPAMIELVEAALGHKAKVIVTVRDIPQILASFEKLHRKHAHERADRGNYFKAQTIAGRCENLLAENDILGISYNRVKDALARGLGDRMHFVEFSELTCFPSETLDKIYDFLELPRFAHDFNNVAQVTEENDYIHGADYHKIRQEVKPVRDDSVKILGKELVQLYTGSEFWRT